MAGIYLFTFPWGSHSSYSVSFFICPTLGLSLFIKIMPPCLARRCILYLYNSDKLFLEHLCIMSVVDTESLEQILNWCLWEVPLRGRNYSGLLWTWNRLPVFPCCSSVSILTSLPFYKLTFTHTWSLLSLTLRLYHLSEQCVIARCHSHCISMVSRI